MQIVCVAGVNDGHVAASESVLMDVLLRPGTYTHCDPPDCEAVEFETSPDRSPPGAVDDNRLTVDTLYVRTASRTIPVTLIRSFL
jgi:hypothetical protein